MAYVPVPADAITNWLEAHSFIQSQCGSEVMYFRPSSRNPSVRIKVYTSIRKGKAKVRGRGYDAIRVTVAYEGNGKSFGIWKGRKILRVTSTSGVLSRIHRRICEAACAGNRWIDKHAPKSEAGLDIEMKNKFAAWEKDQEAKAFASDPDFVAWMKERAGCTQ
jgi:hypothetical protein